MITIRPLTPADFAKATEIDVTETGTLVYRQVGERLIAEQKEWSRRPWTPERYQALVDTWAEILAEQGAVLGAFEGDRLVGEAACRRQGVAGRLVTEVIRLARESGPAALYVSAAETGSAVDFYRRMGFAPTATPHPALLALEPADIHMTISLV